MNKTTVKTKNQLITTNFNLKINQRRYYIALQMRLINSEAYDSIDFSVYELIISYFREEVNTSIVNNL